MSEEDYQKYLESALHFLSYRQRSEKEVRDNLKKKQAPQEIIERIISWLKEQKFINDEEFTRMWIDQRMRLKPKGMRFIKMELLQKGIAREVIDSVIENAQAGTVSQHSLGEEFTIQSDLETAKKIVEKRLLKYKGLERHEIYQKLGGYLARKGFDWETIKRSIDEGLENRNS